MDAVELGYPVDVSKLMGSEGFGGARVTVNEVGTVAAAGAVAAAAAAAASESGSRVSLLVNSCTTFLRQKDVTSAANNSESTTRNKIPSAELIKSESQMCSIKDEAKCEQVQSRCSNFHSSTSRSEAVQVAGKALGKVSRNSAGGCKRPKMAQLEDNMNSAGVDDVKDSSFPAKEKNQMLKQKNSCSKRADKRNFKVPTKSKYESFSMKACLASFGSSAGGNNFMGLYGLKSDMNDVTKDLEELSLKDLLDGSYDRPGLNKDKGKEAANKNCKFLSSFRKACSILPSPKPVESPNFGEMDSSCDKKLLMSSSSSVSLASSGVNSGQRDSSMPHPSSCDKESTSKSGTPVNPLDFPLYQPKDTFERLALPPPKDLEALIMDATKPSASSRTNSDIRSGKQISRRSSLPPFPWSHTFNGHCKNNTDALKLLTSRSTCQGRWAWIDSRAISHGTLTDCYNNLTSLTYDGSLVPPSTSASICWHELSSSLICSKTSLVNLAEHCPRVLAAARTLCNMSSPSSKRNPNGSTKWSKKPPSQISRKVCKSKSFEKPEEVSPKEEISSLTADNPSSSGVDNITSSKRLKLSTTEHKKDSCHINSIRKGSLNWSTQKSSRSSPNKSVRDLIADTKPSATDTLRQSCMLPPPAPSRTPDRAFNGQHKQRKLVHRDWDNKSKSGRQTD